MSQTVPAKSLEEAADFLSEVILAKAAGTPKSVFIAAIDGRAASGKSTLAQSLLENLREQGKKSVLIHLDDFFLRPEQRSEKRLQTPGENVDYERLLEEVILPAETGRNIVCRPFSCQSMRLQDPIDAGKPEILLLEGSYSLNDHLRNHADLACFFTCGPDVQQARILKRSNPDKLQAFIARWIPLEEAYISAWHPQDAADYVFETDSWPAL